MQEGISVVIPCLNESETLEAAIREAFVGLKKSNMDGEVIVSDNGSTDGSQEIAKSNGARVVNVPLRGYGAAVNTGLSEAKYSYLVFADADLSYPLEILDQYADRLKSGSDLVLGNRLHANIEKNAMPFLNRYLGTPVLSFFIRKLYRLPTTDCNSGMRGLRKDFFNKLKLNSPGMEYASEMLIQASRFELQYDEFNIPFRKDKRSRPPHLRRWRDGWRHLRFILGNAPSTVLVIPPLVFGLIFSFYSMFVSISGLVEAGSHGLRYHSAMLSMAAALIMFLFGISSFFLRVAIERSRPGTHKLVRLAFKMEDMSLPIQGALFFILCASVVVGFMFKHWAETGFTALEQMPLLIMAMTFVTYSISLFVADMYLGILKILPFKKGE